MKTMLEAAKAAKFSVTALTTEQKNAALEAMAQALLDNQEAILAAEPARAEAEAATQRNFDNMLKKTMADAGKYVVVLNDEQLAEWQPYVQPTVDRILADMEASHPGFGAMYEDLCNYVANYGA